MFDDEPKLFSGTIGSLLICKSMHYELSLLSLLLGVGQTCQRIINSKQTVNFSHSRSLLNLVVDTECCGIFALKVCDYLHKRILFIIQMINNEYR